MLIINNILREGMRGYCCEFVFGILTILTKPYLAKAVSIPAMDSHTNKTNKNSAPLNTY